MEPSLHGRQRLHIGDNNLLPFLSLMCLQDRGTWNEPEIFRNVLIASFFSIGKPLAIFPTSTLSPHPPPPPNHQPHPLTPPCPKTTYIIWCKVYNPKPSCDLSVRQLKRCYFWEHGCLPVGLLHSKDDRRDLPLPPPRRSPMESALTPISYLFSCHVTSSFFLHTPQERQALCQTPCLSKSVWQHQNKTLPCAPGGRRLLRSKDTSSTGRTACARAGLERGDVRHRGQLSRSKRCYLSNPSSITKYRVQVAFL